MLVALNLAALILVLGITWVGMIWLSGRVHPPQPDRDDTHDASPDPLIRGSSDGPARQRSGASQGREAASRPRSRASRGRDEECATCKGVGAESHNGRIAPCPACLGRGVS